MVPRVGGRTTRRPWASLLALLAVVVGLLACTEPSSENSRPPLSQLGPGELLEPPAPRDPRPIRLTARDGTDLPLQSLELRGTLEDPLAFSELHLEFENPESRALDATLTVTLPRGAQVTRFAALIEGSWRDAEIIERELGPLRPSLYRPANPEFELEPEVGQRFEVELPKVPGRARQQVIVSYAEAFERVDEAYRVHLGGLHDVPRFSAQVVVRGQPDPFFEVFPASRIPEELGMDETGQRRLELHELDWSASGDLVVPTTGQRRTGVRSGRKVAVRINPLTHDHAAPIHGLTVLFDTSASRAVGYGERVEALAGLIEAMQPWTGNEIWLRLIAFDQSYETLYEGPLGGIERGVFERLHARRPLGASNLVGVLRHVGARRGHDIDRVLLISDGVATTGVSRREALFETIAELADNGVLRLDLLADRAELESRGLDGLVRQLPEWGLVLDSEDNPRALVRRLLRTVHDEVRITVPGARWYYPEVVRGVQSDDEILVFADVETVGNELRIEVESHGRHTWRVPLVEVEEPLVGWALERARVEFLVATLEDKAAGQPLAARRQLWRRIVDLSTRNRVLNGYTRLGMPAREQDYARAQLDPAGLPDVLFAGPDGVQRRRRGLPKALADEGTPLARPRLPRFPSVTLDAGLSTSAGVGRGADPGTWRPRSSDADAVATSPGPMVDPSRVRPRSTPAPEPAVDSPEAALQRLRQAKVWDGRRRPERARANPPPRELDDALSGNLLTVMNLIAWGETAQAREVARRWREAEPGEVMAVVALGEALEAGSEIEAAARAYGSIIDMFPNRADMRRFAGSRLEHLGGAGGRLAIDTYRRAREQRPDHPSSHRLLAFALLRAGRPRAAFEVLAAGLRRGWSAEQGAPFAGVERVLREDLGLIAAAWLADEPLASAEIEAALKLAGGELERGPSLRFVLTWETGGSDVDLHVRDYFGSHAYYFNRGLRSGGALDYELTQGYGPEVFSVLGAASGYPYNLQIHYYAIGASGYGMGKVQIVQHDGRGGVEFDERPFVVTKDRATVDLGDLIGPLGER